MSLRVYVSPHLDDAVFSCGGLIARQCAAGDEVRVVTVCAGDPPVGELTAFAYELHRRWGGEGSPMGLRRAEDHVACGRLGASVVHLSFPDAIYRRSSEGGAFYPDAGSIFGEIPAEDLNRADDLSQLLARAAPERAELYLPLGIGGHVDHRLARRAGERLPAARWYYRDLPYALRSDSRPVEPAPAGTTEVTAPLADAEFDAWVAAAAEYASQLSTFWSDFESLERDLRDFHDRHGGIPLLRQASV